jgi:hypothetical protein
MATVNVRARIKLVARVSVINATSGPKEGAQWHNVFNCATKIIDKNEWQWRLHAAEAILQYGTDPYGTTYSGAIGTAWM